MLVPFLKNIKFFKDENIKEDELLEICKKLRYETYLEDEIVFNYGEYGNKFYIIIEGEVGILVPDKQKMLQRGEKMRVEKDLADKAKSRMAALQSINSRSEMNTIGT